MGKLSASILSADLADLADQVKLVEPYADLIHIDVMDGRFAPPLTIGPVVVASVRRHTARTLHAHLMVEAPEALFDELAETGVDLVTFHMEAVADPEPVIRKARGAGMRVGVALSPETPIETVFAHLGDVDDVLVMTTRPGKAESFMPESLPRVRALRTELERRGLDADLEVDGGVRLDDARRCVEAGANVLVAASAIFGAEDVAGAARDLKAIAEAA
jgi:ribulose-phosphate 3-epimerase